MLFRVTTDEPKSPDLDSHGVRLYMLPAGNYVEIDTLEQLILFMVNNQFPLELDTPEGLGKPYELTVLTSRKE